MPSGNVRQVSAYHAHIYYEPGTTRRQAEILRAGLADAFPEAQLGRWHDQPVGPHPKAMFQVAFGADLLVGILPWLMLNRQGLDILLHPETGHERTDHSDHAAWLGHVLGLDLSRFPAEKI